jgi:hypothetical protein
MEKLRSFEVRQMYVERRKVQHLNLHWKQQTNLIPLGLVASSAAMVMGVIDYIWYLKQISWLAMIGFLVGCFAFMVIYPLLH